MSLHCPATLIVARHAEAEYSHGDLLSDEGGRLTAHGREQAAQLATRLGEKRIALVYTSPLARAVETGRIAATGLGVGHREMAGLQEFSVGDLVGEPVDDERLTTTYAAWLAGELSHRIPGAESGEEVVTRFREALSAIADLHRGEHVLVISHGGVMSLGLPNVATGGPAGSPPPLANCASVELSAGDDGWTLGPWAPAEAT
ncbi:histidine phosphatase family protein [Nostocoides australiense]|nr:histidine phosphatase family protein [Tetrasphaera australiensis]HRW03377.1 histidine phosphatase family protein [Tetrasphaera sp.]